VNQKPQVDAKSPKMGPEGTQQIGKPLRKTSKKNKKTTRTSLNLKNVSTCQTSSFNMTCKKEKERELEPKGMLKTLMPFRA
jgi:hypothetical protein